MQQGGPARLHKLGAAMKKIIVLSDGTGNGAAKRNKTNVWRLYRALDLQTNDQIAIYDDGVGSQQFLPLKILGGVFGFGLKENVIQLYKFLCRNYDAEEKDKIYLFGFSRGAFTVRLLASLIEKKGLYTASSDEKDLDRVARRLYSEYRDGYAHNRFFKTITKLKRLLAGRVSSIETHSPKIEFLGVWDTVDAYGLPIDELAVLWHHCIFPIRFPNQGLGPGVSKACHALSIDDERLTFHPVLWDESKEARDSDRIEQVWFAGVHSDVGGGYAMTELSLVTLDWMISRLDNLPAGSELTLIEAARKEYERHADWHGKQHDSRSGLGSYYRYKPRDIAQICQNAKTGVTIEAPKIHRGVFERIQRNVIPYAPTGLPEKYDVVSTRGDEGWPYEANKELKSELENQTGEVSKELLDKLQKSSRSNAEQRNDSLNYARDYVFKRQALYLALLSASILLFASRFFLDWTTGAACRSFACVLDPVLAFASTHLPALTSGWFEALRQNPGWLWGFIAAFSVFFYLKKRLWASTQLAASQAWAKLKDKGEPKDWVETPTAYLRSLSEGKLKVLTKYIVTFVAFLLILALILALLSRTFFYVRSAMGWLESENAHFTSGSTTDFETKNPYYATGIELKQGEIYRFSITIGEAWRDGDIPAGPEGFSSRTLAPFVLIRRSLSESWFQLMGRVGLDGNEEFPIDTGIYEYQAKSDGKLFLYANDAVFGLLPGPYWASPYFWRKGKNKGTATIEVYRKLSGACSTHDTANPPAPKKTGEKDKKLLDCWKKVEPVGS